MLRSMPRLWSQTIDAHRHAVRQATLETTVALVARLGLRGVTMSRIAAETGIGRATLYKYFPDVESILVAWHDEQVASHLAQIEAIRRRDSDAASRLSAVLDMYALIQHDLRTAHGGELTAMLHRQKHVIDTRERVRTWVRELLAEAAQEGEVRRDVPANELATYCLHALAAAASLPSRAAARRLVKVVVDSLQPDALAIE